MACVTDHVSEEDIDPLWAYERLGYSKQIVYRLKRYSWRPTSMNWVDWSNKAYDAGVTVNKSDGILKRLMEMCLALFEFTGRAKTDDNPKS